MKVKPAPGRTVRDPRPPYAILPAEGREVPDHDVYWHRRVRDGDVIAETKAAVAAPATRPSHAPPPAVRHAPPPHKEP